jgi:hypothetical protein
MEREPDRRPGSPAKRCAVRGGVQVARVPRKMNQSGDWPRPETGRLCEQWRSSRPSSSIPCLFTPGRGADSGTRIRRVAGTAPKAVGCEQWGSGPPRSSMEGAPPARQRALNTRGGLGGP